MFRAYFFFFFFFNDTATTEIYTLSLHDALPTWPTRPPRWWWPWSGRPAGMRDPRPAWARSEEHTSELQSQFHLVCRLLLEKKRGVCPLRASLHGRSRRPS